MPLLSILILKRKMAEFSYALRSLDCLTIDPLPEIHLVVEEFEQEESHGCISYETFHGWLCRYIHRDSKSIPYYHQVFKNLDDSGSFSVATPDLICALMPFCPGSKSDKLTMAFSLFSTESSADSSDDLLSIRSLWQVLRSFVAGVSIVVKFPIPSRDVAVSTVGKITSFYKKLKFISLEDISNWYSFCGDKISFWFELLDRRKWPSTSALASYPARIAASRAFGSAAEESTGPASASTRIFPSTAASESESDESDVSVVTTTPSSRENIICSRVIIKIAMKLDTFNKDFNTVWSNQILTNLSVLACKNFLQHILRAGEGFCGRFAAFLYQGVKELSFGSAALAASM